MVFYGTYIELMLLASKLLHVDVTGNARNLLGDLLNSLHICDQ